MCGVPGWFGNLPFDGTRGAAMAPCRRHRGPGAEGILLAVHLTLEELGRTRPLPAVAVNGSLP